MRCSTPSAASTAAAPPLVRPLKHGVVQIEDRLAGLGDDLIAAHVIGIGARVDHVTNRLRRERVDGGHDSARAWGVSAVDDNDAIGTDLDADVARRLRRSGRSSDATARRRARRCGSPLHVQRGQVVRPSSRGGLARRGRRRVPQRRRRSAASASRTTYAASPCAVKHRSRRVRCYFNIASRVALNSLPGFQSGNFEAFATL